MRPIRRPLHLAVLAFLLALPVVSACGSPPPPPAPRVELETSPFEKFSSDRAWRDLEALVAIGPRVSGTPGGTAARVYLREQLAQLDGIEVEEIVTKRELEGLGEIQHRHVVASSPGASTDVLVLVAPYDSSHFEGFTFVGANQGASGAALVLELFRVLSERDLHYTLRAFFVDGEGRLGQGGEALEESRGLGSEELADHFAEGGDLERIRLLVAFDRVCDEDLEIARDLGSHRMHREEFFRAASPLDRGDAFAQEQPFQSPQESHVAFRERGVRPVVAIVDTSFGGGDPPGIYADTEDDMLGHCSPQSLETVGLVSIEAVSVIAARLAKIDRFSRSPLSDVANAPETAPRAKASEPEAAGGAATGAVTPVPPTPAP